MKRLRILPIVLYGCLTWSLKLTEKCSLRVTENNLPKRIFRPKQDKVTEVWRKLHNEELKDTNCLPHIIWVIKSRRRAGQGLGREGVHAGCVGEIAEKECTWKTQT